MASDNILTRQEKISLRREWQEIVYEFLEIESTAISQGIPSSNTAFSNFKSKGNALGTYLNGGTAWTISSSNKTSHKTLFSSLILFVILFFCFLVKSSSKNSKISKSVFNSPLSVI